MEFQRVDKRAKTKWRFSRIMALIFVVLPLAALAVFFGEYLIAPDRIEIKKGIFYKTHTVIPISRIQHVAVTQGVLQRPFRLSTVQIHTAGDVMEIQELNTAVAEEICSRLQKRVNVKAGQAPDAAAADGQEE